MLETQFITRADYTNGPGREGKHPVAYMATGCIPSFNYILYGFDDPRRQMVYEDWQWEILRNEHLPQAVATIAKESQERDTLISAL